MSDYQFGRPSPSAQEFADRQQRQNRELETPIVCPECGSTWFTEQTFNQYSSIAYSSSAGGDIRQINAMPQIIRVCVCGHPYEPNLSGIRGRLASEALSSFRDSMSKAHSMRKSIIAVGKQQPVNLDTVAKNFASVEEIQSLRDEISNVLEIVSDLERKPELSERAAAAPAVNEESAEKVSSEAGQDAVVAVAQETASTQTGPHAVPAGVTVVPPAPAAVRPTKITKEEREKRLAADKKLAGQR